MRKIGMLITILALGFFWSVPVMAGGTNPTGFTGAYNNLYIYTNGKRFTGIWANDLLATDSAMVVATGMCVSVHWCSNFQHAGLAQVDLSGRVDWFIRFGKPEDNLLMRNLSYLTRTESGIIYAVGSTRYDWADNGGDTDLFLVKVSNGNLIWQKTLDHPSSDPRTESDNQYPYGITVLENGNIGILATVARHLGSINYYTLSPDGEVLFETAVASSGQAWFVSDGFIVFVHDHNYENAYWVSLKKYDFEGNLIWWKGYPYYGCSRVKI